MVKKNETPKIRRKQSKLHGRGVFALEPINKNKRIIDYAGEKVRNRDSTKREIPVSQTWGDLVLSIESPVLPRRCCGWQYGTLH